MQCLITTSSRVLATISMWTCVHRWLLFSNVSFCQKGAHYHVERGLSHASRRRHFITGAECWWWEHRHVYYRVRFPLRAAAFLNEMCSAWKVITDAYLEMFLLTISQKRLKMSFFFVIYKGYCWIFNSKLLKI